MPITGDRAVLMETDPGVHSMPLLEYARTLDFPRIEKALEQPPRVDFTLTQASFSAIRKGDDMFQVHEWLGTPEAHETVGRNDAGRIRWRYRLRDGGIVVLISAGWKVESVTLP